MEPWQKELIKKNIRQLITDTQITTEFLSIFSVDVISFDEFQEFEAEWKNGHTRAAGKFYRIIETRTGAFGILMKALKDTKQSGVHAILNDSINLKKERLPSVPLTSELKKFSRVPEYITSFLNNKDKTKLIVLTKDNQITRDRILMKGSEFIYFDTVCKFLDYATKQLGQKVDTVSIVDCGDKIRETIHQTCKISMRCVLIAKILPSGNQPDIRSFIDNPKYCKFIFVHDTLEWDDLTPKFQFDICSKVELDLSGRLKTLQIMKALENADNNTLIELINGNAPSLFKDPTPANCPYYIERTMVSRRLVSQDIFNAKVEENDVFVLRKITKEKLFDLTCQKMRAVAYRKLIKHGWELLSSIIIADLEKHFNQICKNITNKSVHLLHFDSEKNLFIWRKTKGNIAIIQRSLLSNQLTCSERDLHRDSDNMKDKEIHHVCISGTSGMGKSLLLANVAANLRNKYGNGKVFLVRFSELIEKLKPLISDSKIDDAVTTALAKCLCLNKLGEEYLLENKYELKELLIDGFDELNSEDVDFVYNCLTILRSQFPKTRLWVTARPHMLLKTEQTLGVTGYNINPFTVKEQVLFLKSFWTRNSTKDKNLASLTRFAKLKLEDIKSKIDPGGNDIAGIPLQCMLIGEVFEDEAKDAMDDIPMMKTSFRHISDLYEKYIQKKLLIYSTKYHTSSQENVKISLIQKIVQIVFLWDIVQWVIYGNKKPEKKHQDLVNKHVFLSVYEVMPSLAPYIEKSLCSQNVSQQQILDSGFMESLDIASNPKFIHRTFPEYFIASWLLECLYENNNESSFRLVFNEVLSTHQNTICLPKGSLICFEFRHLMICNFINSGLTKLPRPPKITNNFQKNVLPELLNACISCNFTSLLSFVFGNNIQAKTILEKTNVDDLPFISAFHGHTHMLEVCQKLKIFENVNLNQIRKHNYSLLHFAVAGGNFKAVEYLCKLENFSHSLKYKNDEFSDLLYLCVIKTKNIDDKCVQDRINILKFLVDTQKQLMLFQNQHNQTILGLDDTHDSLITEFICFLRRDPENLRIYLHGMPGKIKTDQYLKLLKLSLKNKSTIVQTEMINSTLNDVPLIHTIIQSMEPCKETIYFFNSQIINYNVLTYKESIFETALRNKRGAECLRWLGKSTKLTEDGLLNSLKLLFQYEEKTIVKSVVDSICVGPSTLYCNGNTLLHVLMKSNLVRNNDMIVFVESLLFQGININCLNSKNQTPLHILALNLNFSPRLWNYFVHNNASYLKKDVENQTPASYLLKNLNFSKKDVVNSFKNVLQKHDAETAKIVILLLGEQINNRCTNGNSFLHILFTVKKGNNFSLDIAKYLIESGAECNSKNINGETPLHKLASKIDFSPECWRCLCLNGADMLSLDNENRTPISKVFKQVCRDSDINICRDKLNRLDILNLHACQTARDKVGNCMLHYAATANKLNILTIIYSVCNDPNVTNNKNETPLHLLAREKTLFIYSNCWVYLVDNKANLIARDTSGKTPVHTLVENIVFSKKNIENNIKLLFRCFDTKTVKIAVDLINLKPNLIFTSGNTLLHLLFAVQKYEYLNPTDITEYIIQRGTNVNAVNSNGETPLSICANNGSSVECCKLLHDKGAKFMSSTVIYQPLVFQHLRYISLIDKIVSTKMILNETKHDAIENVPETTESSVHKNKRALITFNYLQSNTVYSKPRDHKATNFYKTFNTIFMHLTEHSDSRSCKLELPCFDVSFSDVSKLTNAQMNDLVKNSLSSISTDSNVISLIIPHSSIHSIANSNEKAPVWILRPDKRFSAVSSNYIVKELVNVSSKDFSENSQNVNYFTEENSMHSKNLFKYVNASSISHLLKTVCSNMHTKSLGKNDLFQFSFNVDDIRDLKLRHVTQFHAITN